MTMNEYQALAARTINNSMNRAQQEAHALHGLAAEVGEIHSLYQKIYQGHAIEEAHIQKELGDLQWFVAELATAYGWHLEDVAAMNIDKLRARYPEGFDVQRSLHRAEGDI
jgi:NTP pyrophosphatase (non-canonical NTP hydrolase)